MAGMSSLLSSGSDSSKLIVDRISSLPCNVIDIILGKLSVVEAVRTSILAKDWQYKWLSLSKLIIKYNALTRVLKTRSIRWEIYKSIINRFLLLHTCEMKAFHIEAFCIEHYADMYSWIEYISKLGIEELFIAELGDEQHFQMPSHLFKFDRLQSLYLRKCAVRIPSIFEGFNFLRELGIGEVSITDGDLYQLVIACPLLVKLIVNNALELEHLRIHSPRLRELQIDTRIEDITIEVAPCLVSVRIENASALYRTIRNWQNIIRCLSNLNTLQNLELFGDFIQILAADYAIETFPLRNNTLTSLSLYNVRFDRVEVVRVCLSLLNSCPNIKFFQFTILSAKGPDLLTTFLTESRGQFSFPQLETISVICPSRCGMGCTSKVIEFMGSNSPNLRVLRIKKEGKMHPSRVSAMLSRCRKCCPQAEILIDVSE